MGFARVAQRYPNSRIALLGMACPLWDIGYRDLALLYYTALVADGLRPPSPQPAHGCFAARPSSVGIASVSIGRARRVYVADLTSNQDRQIVRLLQRAAADERSLWQAELLLACLNDRHDFKLVAGTNFVAAEAEYQRLEGSGTKPRRAVDVPQRCTDIASDYSLRTTRAGQTVSPRDAERRFYVPGVSPVPYPETDPDA